MKQPAPSPAPHPRIRHHFNFPRKENHPACLRWLTLQAHSSMRKCWGAETRHKFSPRQACSFVRNVLGIPPSPASLNVPKSLHQGPSGTCGLLKTHCIRRTRSCAVRARVLARSSKCSRTARGNLFQPMYGTGQSENFSPKMVFSISFHRLWALAGSGSDWNASTMRASLRFRASPTRSTRVSTDSSMDAMCSPL